MGQARRQASASRRSERFLSDDEIRSFLGGTKQRPRDVDQKNKTQDVANAAPNPSPVRKSSETPSGASRQSTRFGRQEFVSSPKFKKRKFDDDDDDDDDNEHKSPPARKRRLSGFEGNPKGEPRFLSEFEDYIASSNNP